MLNKGENRRLTPGQEYLLKGDYQKVIIIIIIIKTEQTSFCPTPLSYSKNSRIREVTYPRLYR